MLLILPSITTVEKKVRTISHQMLIEHNTNINFELDWVFYIPPLYHKCGLGEAECDALGAVKLHDFNHSVYAPNSINVTCEEGQRSDGLPDWTWYAEGYTFHRPIPK